jgi:N-glycosylase/DNA lyase
MKAQSAFVENGKCLIRLEIPNENEQILPGVKWGKAIAFPTVAYWYYKIIANRLANKSMKYRLGNNLVEEVAACLLGGHGILAATGNAAFKHMKDKGAFTGDIPSEDILFGWLSEPIFNGKKYIKYRFAKQKSSYLYHALCKFKNEAAPTQSGKELRDWLTDIKGVGLKTASWVARNWLDADDIAILDIHIYRAGILGGFFDESMKVEKNYLEMENIFLTLAEAMEVRASELDALIWFEMQQKPNINLLLQSKTDNTQFSLSGRANQRHSNAKQLSLIG